MEKKVMTWVRKWSSKSEDEALEFWSRRQYDGFSTVFRPRGFWFWKRWEVTWW